MSTSFHGPPFIIPGGWTIRELIVENRGFVLTLPADPDAFLDDPRVHVAHQQNGYMPYWGYLWPAALDTAAAILRHPWTPGLTVLEIGAGIGLAGLAALSKGLRVTFSDYDEQSVALCLHNARQNGFAEARGFVLDWRDPSPQQFDVILGSDVVYEEPNHAPILRLVQTMLAPGGECWLTDPDRHQADAFARSASAAGFQIDATLLPREAANVSPGVTTRWSLRRQTDVTT